jgi:CRP-like cAMP-binding protein
VLVTGDFLRGRNRDQMSAEDKQALEDAVSDIRTLPPRTTVTRRGERVRECMLLLEGTMCRYMDARDGYRQLVAMQVPGDFVDLHGFPMHRLDHDIGTLSESRIAAVPHERVAEIVRDRPSLAKLLWRSTLLDAALHREWIFRLGRLDAAGRVAHFLCETSNRLAAVGRVKNGVFALPLTQQDLGEAVGLTSVHVNRTLRRLREEGLAEIGRGEAHIMDAAKLARLGEFDADYLYLEGGPWTGEV